MRLRQYFTANNLDIASFAKSIGVSPEAVRLWLAGKRVPRRRLLKRIVEATDGAVQANDFHEAA